MKLSKPSQLVLVSTIGLLVATIFTACQLVTVDFVYVAGTGSSASCSGGEVQGFAVDSESGALRTGPPAACLAGNSPVAMAVSPDYANLYVATSDNDTVVHFALASDGTLTKKDSVTLPGPPVSLAVNQDIKVEVKAGAICGTDIHFYHWDPASANFPVRFPLILGHEYAGDVVEIGADVRGIAVGDRISVETHIPCGACYQCGLGEGHNCQDMGLVGISYPGAFAKYAKVPAKVAFKLPPGVSYEEGSLFEPAGVAMRGVDEAHIAPGDLVVILGCGPIGLIAIQIARAVGAAQVIGVDINEFRLEMARRMGALPVNAAKESVVDAVKQVAGRRGRRRRHRAERCAGSLRLHL